MTTPIRQRLRDALKPAMKARDKLTLSAVRSALGAIDNAEAIDSEERAGAAEASAQGAGAAEGRRRALTDADIEAVVRAEIDDRATAAEECIQHGADARAKELRQEIAVLTGFLDR